MNFHKNGVRRKKRRKIHFQENVNRKIDLPRYNFHRVCIWFISKLLSAYLCRPMEVLELSIIQWDNTPLFRKKSPVIKIYFPGNDTPTTNEDSRFK